MKPKIISIGFAVPENSYSQAEVFQELGYPGAFRRVFTESNIDKRHFWVPLERIKELSFQEQQEEYIRGAISLSKEAALNCLDDRSPDTIGCVVFCSCTGFCPGPTVPHYLVKDLELGADTYMTNMTSHGCEGGFPGLKRGADFTISSGKSSLIVACELSSCSYFPEPRGKPDPENHFEVLRSNALFADAASAVLVGFDDDLRHPYIIDSESYFNPEYMNDLGYTWRDGRLRVLLSRRVPNLAPLVVKPAVEGVLKRQNLDISDIGWFVIHAAGSVVLDNLRDALGLLEEKLSLSRETLRQFGNCSSTTIGLTGKTLISQDIKPGDYAAVLSIGPGMVGGMTLLRWPKEKE